MFSSNSFGALAMDDTPEPPAAAAPASGSATRLIEGEDADAEVCSAQWEILTRSGSSLCAPTTT